MSKAEIRGEGGTLKVSGELTFSSVTGLLGQSRPLFAAAGERITVDLSEVARSDSAGLAMLIEWMRLAAAQNSRVEFLHLPAQMMAIAEASDLDEVLPLADKAG